jgi:ribonuclease HII
MNIAAASILAKTYRDNIMIGLSKEYPLYKWGKNKGYPTVEHRKEIFKNGKCIHHRNSFQLKKI